jgi:hypothetical protein
MFSWGRYSNPVRFFSADQIKKPDGPPAKTDLLVGRIGRVLHP